MSDLEDSRTTAVGRKRKYQSISNNITSRRRGSSEISKESGEISSDEVRDIQQVKDTGGIPFKEHSDSDIEEISADQWTKTQMQTEAKTRTKRQRRISTSSISSDSSSDDSSVQELPRKKGDMTRLLDISRNEQKQQAKYFNLKAMSEPVRCICCGGRGHMAKDCSTRTCSHCQKRDAHPSSACPTFRKCGLCRERGHDAATCRNRSCRVADPCDVCQKTGHIEVSECANVKFHALLFGRG